MGPFIANYYEENMYSPKGWKLTYGGKEGNVDVFVFEVDLKNDPSYGDGDGYVQVMSLFCRDDGLRDFIDQGMKVRVDMRRFEKGRSTLSKGTRYVTCNN
ncbi:hypothetical protein [Croceibacterium salegens]|nr:hypothetical protein [Croceibacterium salegens]